MSITILEQDNLNVIIWKWAQLISEHWKTIQCIHLFVNLQVNGKIKQLFQSLSSEDWKLEDYTRFWVLVETLDQLWYETMWIYDRLEEWISKL